VLDRAVIANQRQVPNIRNMIFQDKSEGMPMALWADLVLFNAVFFLHRPIDCFTINMA
jgi:hypothetical protein